MHSVLQIPEILLNIFGHSPLPGMSVASDLPALARTCRSFKEPALDVLWKELLVPSALARCLPEASHFSQTKSFLGESKCYSFNRPLTQVEWVIIQSYTRRIRFMTDHGGSLDWESVGTFLNPLATEPLFPNLRHLDTTATKTKHLLYMPFPSLISLFVRPEDENQDRLQGCLESFFKFSPNIKRFSIHLHEHDIKFCRFFSSYICRWRDLYAVYCDSIPLDVDALAHLSGMPALTELSCTPSATLPPSDAPLVFSSLHRLKLHSEFLYPISLLLSRIQLPAITNFVAYVDSRPSKQSFSSFLTSVQASVISHTIHSLKFADFSDAEGTDLEDDVRPDSLDFEDLRPCMAFGNLRDLDLNLSWNVNLTDSGLLALASAWPYLERLSINEGWGWGMASGITPNGLLQLFRTCRLLMTVALIIDTNDYTEFRESPASLGLTLPATFRINVLDSFIEEENVPAIAAFLAAIAPRPNFSFRAYDGSYLGGQDDEDDDLRVLWYEAYRQANVTLSQRS